MLETAELPLLASTQSYNLDGIADESILFSLSATLMDNRDGGKTPLRIIREQEFNELDQDETGEPTVCYIDRSKAPVLRV